VQPIAARREVGVPQPIARASEVNEARRAGGISRSEIDESLRNIDDHDPRPRGKRKRGLSPKLVKKIIKRLLLAILIIAIGLGAYVGFKALFASNSIFKGNVFDILQAQPLKQDANGRTNILILGTSEDDPGHQGGNLTDSMMILSVDQTKKNAYMISIPRDLYVKYGEACDAGYQGKINVYYSCVGGGDPKNTDATRSALTKTGNFVGDIFGLDIQYGVNVNYTVMRDLVNAVGGITVTIESRDPRGQMDSNFDWKCGRGVVSRAEQIKRCPPSGHFIDYPNGPVNLDAEHALYLAQARGDIAPTYGFEQSNFDREKNQQKIIKAIREKAMSAGVLTDFTKVTGIIDSLGNNLRTTFETKEIRTLVNLAKDIQSNNIQSISLIDGDSPVMGTGNVGGQSVVRPNAGTYEYGELQAYIKEELSSNPITREKAKVAIMNGSGVAGAAQTESDKLKDQGFVIGELSNAPEGDYGKVKIYQIDKTKTATAAKLKEIYGVTPLQTKPPVTVSSDTAFVVIVGTIAKVSATSTSQ
jgi:LCP family protein required for cell wall assembly